MKLLNTKSKLIKDLSANGIQIIVNQIIGLVLFYFSSTYLLKESFGHYNWALAVGSTVIAILSFGLDLIVVKRVASGKEAREVVGMHLLHVIVSGAIALIFLLLFYAIYEGDNGEGRLNILLPVFVYLVIGNVANSFKLCLNGLEAYQSLAVVLVTANVLKLVGVALLFFIGHFGLDEMLLVYVLASIVELFLAAVFANKNFDRAIRPRINWGAYFELVKEALPQLGVVLFDSALARIDWILLGLMGTAIATAEYSFTYRVFELSKLPLLILSPILLTRLTKLFGLGTERDLQKEKDVLAYFKLEMIVMMVIPIVLVQVWSPLVDLITHGKYGAVNEVTYSILAICVPLHALINFLWTMAFVKGMLKPIMWITVVSSLINIVANLILIPKFSAVGAAVAFLISTVVQTILYFVLYRKMEIKLKMRGSFMVLIFAFVAVAFGRYVSVNLAAEVLVSLFVFVMLSVLGKQLELNQLKTILKTGKA